MHSPLFLRALGACLAPIRQNKAPPRLLAPRDARFPPAGRIRPLPASRAVCYGRPAAPHPPTLSSQGQGGQLPISRGGQRRHQAESCWQLRGSEGGYAQIQLCTAGFPIGTPPPHPGITANFRTCKMKGLGTLGLVLGTGESALAGVPVNSTDLKAHPHSAIHFLCDLMLVTTLLCLIP